MDFATGISLVESTKDNFFIKVNHGITTPESVSPDLGTLIAPSQARAAGVYVDETPHSLNRNQCIINQAVVTSMTFVHSKMAFKVIAPAEEELSKLPVYDITPTQAWRPSHEQVVEFDLASFKDPFLDCQEEEAPSQRRRHLQRDVFSDKLAVSETDYAAPLEHHTKHQFPQFMYKRFSDVVYTDTMVCKRNTPSIRGFRYAKVFVSKRTRLLKVHLMKRRSNSVYALRQFHTNVDCPDLLCYDQAGEENSDIWEEECRTCKVPTHWSAAYHQHQNLAEVAIRDIKAVTARVLNSSDNAPDRYWCFATELAVKIISHSASPLLNKNPARGSYWRHSRHVCFLSYSVLSEGAICYP